MTPLSSLRPAALALIELGKAATDRPYAVREGTYALHQPRFECWIPQDINDTRFLAAAANDGPRLAAAFVAILDAIRAREERDLDGAEAWILARAAALLAERDAAMAKDEICECGPSADPESRLYCRTCERIYCGP